ncbi:MAG TPA: NnrS family protein, partial [Pseudomonadales bacterium]
MRPNDNSSNQPKGPSIDAFLSVGFRPFYLGAALFAALAMPFWTVAFLGGSALPSHLSPYTWHVHEMLFGFAPAVMAGFLLTAARNWTGLPTSAGSSLAALFTLWLLGRAAPLFCPPAVAAAVDLAFLPVLAGTLAIPLWRARNTRNLFVIAVLLVLWVANALFHRSLLDATA